MSLTLWDTSSTEDVNINETAAKVLKTEDLTPKLPEVGCQLNGLIRLDGLVVAWWYHEVVRLSTDPNFPNFF